MCPVDILEMRNKILIMMLIMITKEKSISISRMVKGDALDHRADRDEEESPMGVESGND